MDEKRCEQLKAIILDYKSKLLNFDNHEYWLKFRKQLEEFFELDLNQIKSNYENITIQCYGKVINNNSEQRFN